MSIRFSIVRSVVVSLGPRRTERGALPKVESAGLADAEGANHRASVRASDGSCGSRTRSGRSGPAGNALVVLAAVTTVNGAPDIKVSGGPIRQAPGAGDRA